LFGDSYQKFITIKKFKRSLLRRIHQQYPKIKTL
jgi:hypothetical protein